METDFVVVGAGRPGFVLAGDLAGPAYGSRSSSAASTFERDPGVAVHAAP